VRRAVALSLGLALLLSACSGGGAHHRTLTVFAAASLTESFGTIGSRFEKAHPAVTVRFSFGPSDGLAQQIQAGASVDVFASASEKWMDAVASNPGATGRVDFTRNRLTIVVPAGNPANIAGLADLARPGVKLVLAAEGVPAGDYAQEALANAGIGKAALANVVSNEIDVKGVLAKVASGDADVGIVYVTDVTPDVASKVEAIRIPDAQNVIAAYPIAVVRGSVQTGLAGEFVRFVLGPGQAVLRGAGFLPAA